MPECDNADENYDGEETLDMENEEQEKKECHDSISSDMYESTIKKYHHFGVLSPWSSNCIRAV